MSITSNDNIIVLQAPPQPTNVCDEELIAMAISLRVAALADDSLCENYILLREVCWRQTNVDVAVLGHWMDKFASQVRTD